MKDWVPDIKRTLKAIAIIKSTPTALAGCRGGSGDNTAGSAVTNGSASFYVGRRKQNARERALPGQYPQLVSSI
jgi:hypothetical protein